MTNMLSAVIEMMGTRPLLLNRFGPEVIPLTKSERTGVAGNDPEEWKRRVCWTPERQLYLEPSAIFGAIRDGGRFTKKGRRTLQSEIIATVQIDCDRILIDRFLPNGEIPRSPTEPVFLDIRGVRMKASGSWNVRYRLAASRGWEASFRVLWDKTILSRQELQAACIDAGRFAGIGDGRKIGFERFEVVRFEVQHAENPAAA